MDYGAITRSLAACFLCARYNTKQFIGSCKCAGGFDTNWDGHHDGGVVDRGWQFPPSANTLSGKEIH